MLKLESCVSWYVETQKQKAMLSEEKKIGLESRDGENTSP